MVTAKHIGRLGNNLFQIAAAIGYARKYGYQWAVDPSNGHGEPYSSIHKVFPNLPKAEPSGMRYHEHPHGFCPQHNMSYDDCHFDYHDIPNLGSNVVLSGFFQSWRYFEHCKEEVKEVFKLPWTDLFLDHASIHVRRGDYVQHSGSFPPVGDSYLMDAIFAMDGNGYKKFIFFSDDIDWCKLFVDRRYTGNGVFDDYEFKFCYETDELQSLGTMASCGSHIIANSSFSWWAAYLGRNPNRIVISPSAETWFGPTAGVKKPVKDLILPEWHQINTR